MPCAGPLGIQTVAMIAEPEQREALINGDLDVQHDAALPRTAPSASPESTAFSWRLLMHHMGCVLRAFVLVY